METYVVHYTSEKMDQCHDMEKDVTVPNIDFVIPTFRQEIRLYKKITGIFFKPNVQPNTENHEQF